MKGMKHGKIKSNHSKKKNEMNDSFDTQECSYDDLATAPQDSKKRSILELRGLGKEIWQDVDAQKYVDSLRKEWDHRP